MVDGSTEIVEFDEIDIPVEHGLLLKAMRDLRDSDPLDNKFSELDEHGKALALELDNLIIELEKYDVDGLIEQAREQIKKYHQTARWSEEDAKQLIAKATTLDLPEDLKISEIPNTPHGYLSESDANHLATSARKLIERYDQGNRLLAFSIDQADEWGPKVRGLLGLIKPLEFF